MTYARTPATRSSPLLWAALFAAVRIVSASEDIRQAQLEDLAAAKAQYVLKSKAFSAPDRRKALAFVDRMERRAGSWSDAGFLLGMLHITALARNAHDSLDVGEDAWSPSARLPFRMLWFPEALIIARAGPQAEDLLGARVRRIEGLTPQQLLARLRTLSGGTPCYLMWDSEWVLEDAGLLYAMGIARDPSRLRLQLQLKDGVATERSVDFIPVSLTGRGPGAVRMWSPELSDAGVTGIGASRPPPLRPFISSSPTSCSAPWSSRKCRRCTCSFARTSTGTASTSRPSCRRCASACNASRRAT